MADLIHIHIEIEITKQIKWINPQSAHPGQVEVENMGLQRLKSKTEQPFRLQGCGRDFADDT